MPRQMAGYGTLARAGRAVNGYDDLAGGTNAARKVFFRTHARFFVSCLGLDWDLGRAVKPNRLLFPAFAPAVKAGLRLLRPDRESARASVRVSVRAPVRPPGLGLAVGLAPLEWPLR